LAPESVIRRVAASLPCVAQSSGSSPKSEPPYNPIHGRHVIRLRVAAHFLSYGNRGDRTSGVSPADPINGTASRAESSCVADAALGRRRVDNRSDLRDPIDWESTLRRVLADKVFIRRDVDAIDPVRRDEALDPLDLWSKLAKYIARNLRHGSQLFVAQLTGTEEVSLDYILRHSSLHFQIALAATRVLFHRFYPRIAARASRMSEHHDSPAPRDHLEITGTIFSARRPVKSLVRRPVGTTACSPAR
jgi:hypothetical protein